MVRSALLAAVMVPWCSSTICLAMASPSPAPPVRLCRAESSRKNFSNSRLSWASEMGSPALLTVMRTASPSLAAVSRMSVEG